MRSFLVSALLLVTFLPVPAAAEESAPLTDPEFQKRLAEATAFHDQGKFDEALAALEALLQVRPDEPAVLCELGNTFLALGRPDDAERVSRRALEQKTVNVAFCSIVLGSACDAKGDLKAGEKVFRDAVKKAPDVPGLRFNYGVNLSQQGRQAEAIEQYEEAVSLRPEHASSWRALALAWQSIGAKGKEFVASARFLTLEPDSPRSPEMARSLWKILFAGVSNEGPDPKTGKGRINITVAAPAKNGGHIDTHALMLSIVAAGRYMGDWENKSDHQYFEHAFGTVLSILEEAGISERKEKAFWNERVLPYFQEARKAGHLEAMAWDVRRSMKDPEIDAWIAEHAEQMASFRAWSKDWKN